VERRQASALAFSARRHPLMRIIGYAPAGVSPPFFLSSLPDLIRQSKRTRISIESADTLSEPHVSMDHRVKPGGDEVFWL
jgi:hypothetical protein